MAQMAIENLVDSYSRGRYLIIIKLRGLSPNIYLGDLPRLHLPSLLLMTMTLRPSYLHHPLDIRLYTPRHQRGAAFRGSKYDS